MILAASSAGSPAMPMTLSRDVAPRVTAKADLGSRQVSASSSITAAFALPSSAGAVTWALRAPLAQASAVRRARGWARSSTVTPATVRRTNAGSPDTRLEPDVILDDVLVDDDQQQSHDRRNIDAAQVGQEAADRSQHRLGDAIEQVDDHADDLVADVDDAERNQPAHDSAGNDDAGIDAENVVDELAHRHHRLAESQPPAGRRPGTLLGRDCRSQAHFLPLIMPAAIMRERGPIRPCRRARHAPR